MPSTPLTFSLARPTKAPYLFGLVITVILFGLAGFLAWMFFAPRIVVFELTSGGLTIKGDLYGRTIPWAAVDVAAATPILPGSQPELDPVRRTNGVALANYRSGWFRLRNGESGLLFVTDRSKLLHLPTTLGYELLISPDEPGEFLKALALKSANDRPFPLAPYHQPSSEKWLALLPLAFLIGLPVFLLLVLRSIERTQVIVGPNDLRIKALCYGRTVNHSQLDVSRMRLTDLKTDPDFRGMLRTNGIGLPGFLAGWFRKLPRSRYLMFVTRPTQVVVVPTRDDYSLVISPADSQALATALQEVARGVSGEK